MGVEPTRDILCPPTDLKSAKPTGTHTLPNIARIIVASDLTDIKQYPSHTWYFGWLFNHLEKMKHLIHYGLQESHVCGLRLSKQKD